MKRKYLAFDIETAKILPADDNELLAHRPLGICCLAILAADEKQPQVFYSRDDHGKPSPQMSQRDLSAFVDFLIERQNADYTIVTMNGLGFDFDVLAEESSRPDDCKQIARKHVDMMFHVLCVKGFPVGLNAATKAIGKSKPDDIDGSKAPQLWKDGRYQKVLNYVAQDCRLTLDVAEASEKRRQFQWVTQKNTVASFPLPSSGWLSVQEAMKLPLPDTSWMSKPPLPREKFTWWLDSFSP